MQKRTPVSANIRRTFFRRRHNPVLFMAAFAGLSLTLLAGCMQRSLTSLRVLPAAGKTSIGVGQTTQFQAQGVFTESGHATTTEDLTSSVTWQSANPGVATIDSSGVATGVSAGTTTITATTHGQFGTVTGTSDIAVAAGGSSATRTLTSLTLIPGSQTLATTGQTAQFIAIANYSAAPLTVNVSNLSTWKTSDSSVATVGATTGLATGTGVGTATITALYTSAGTTVTGSSTLTIASAPTTRTLTALTITPGSQTITSTGQTAQLIAIGTYNVAPLSADLTTQVAWKTSDPQVATVNASGVVTGVGVGSATITGLYTASDGSVTASTASLSVTTASSGRILTSLSIIPSSQAVSQVGETARFLAIGTYSASPLTEDLTDQVTWRSSDVQVAQIAGSGLATAVGNGAATITAIAIASDSSVITATAVLDFPVGTVASPPTLTVSNLGNGTGSVTGYITGTNNVVFSNCGTGPGCSASLPLNTTVTLNAFPGSNSTFNGWSANCTPVDSSGNASQDPKSPYCQITMIGDETVGAIFDPQ
jgi:uncharacterized protein YjdB